MLGVYALINILLVGFAVMRPGLLGAYALVATRFLMSLTFPTIFALGVRGLAPDTKLGGSVIAMAVAGAAVLPPTVAYIASRTGSYSFGYSIPVAAYVVVASFGFGAHSLMQEQMLARHERNCC